MRMIRCLAVCCPLVLVALVICFAVSPTAHADDAASHNSRLLGEQAPPFVLPIIGQDQAVDSDTLFDAYALTLLAFWTTHCTECAERMAACQELHDWGKADGFNVVSINFDEHPSSKMRSVADKTAPRVVHLYDSGGRLSSAYEAGSHSFSAYLIDGMGTVRSVYFDVKPQAFRDLRPQLTVLIDEAYSDDFGSYDPVDHPADGYTGSTDDQRDNQNSAITTSTNSSQQSRIDLHGSGRLRWMSVDTTGVGAVGSNGEPLASGRSLRRKIDLELSYRITPELTAGGLIRISNEGPGVLRSGPQYLSHETGSIFIRHDKRGQLPGLGRFESSFIGGYYKIALTPLTMIRWDTSDTPISGGQRSQGCGCSGNAGSAGFIRSESLEQLGADLFFEGARWDLSLMNGFDLLTFYARTQNAKPDDPVNCCLQPVTETFYQQDLYGARLKRHLSMPGTVELIEVGATTLLVTEDEEQPMCDTGCMSHNPYKNLLFAGDIKLPLPDHFTCNAEIALSHWTPNKSRYPDNSLDGLALQAALIKEFHLPWTSTLGALELDDFRCRVEVAWQRVETDFFSPYGALSLEPNRQGFRASIRTDWGPIGIGGFYKLRKAISVADYLDQIEPLSIHNDKHITWSTWLDAEAWAGGVLMIGGVFDKQGILKSIAPDVDMGLFNRKTLIVSIEQELAPKCTMALEGEWMNGEWYDAVGYTTPTESIKNEYDTRVIRVVMGVEF